MNIFLHFHLKIKQKEEFYFYHYIHSFFASLNKICQKVVSGLAWLRSGLQKQLAQYEVNLDMVG
jgi:hypothetical protein